MNEEPRFDVVVTGGNVVDGSGTARRRADIAIDGGRIAAIRDPGGLDGAGRSTVDATGKVVAPGFVDPHTHYDAQLHWDPSATPSCLHGVTTVIGGNCGFTLAPLRAVDADYTRRMMAQVEGMPLAALETGVDWSWSSFGEFLDRLDGNVAVNAGFLVGHCALRRFVIGPEAIGRESTLEELAALKALLAESIDAGGLGFSTTLSSTHNDGEGKPVASRYASHDEVLELCSVVAEHDGTTLEAIVQGCLGQFSDDEVTLLATMSARANRPLNWNVLSISAENRDRARHQLKPSSRAREIGRVVALSMPVFSDNNMSLLTFCALWLLPGWREILDRPVPERIAMLKDPAVRDEMMAKAVASETLGQLVEFERYMIGPDELSDENAALRGRMVGEIAAERGTDPFTTLVDIVANDELKTVLWPQPAADAAADWELRREFWEEPDVLLGGSDAGAHLDRMLGASYPTKFLGDCIRGRKLVSVERAVQLMTDEPARLFGLRERGRIAEGYHADVVVFDPATVTAEPAYVSFDLPGGSKRLLAGSVGIDRVFVNGVLSIADGQPTGARAGTVLRSGRDTESVTTA
jgi:N-acyl-D-aspartate/D-glutamate deacylase